MTNQEKRCINKVLRLVRAIQKEVGVNPKNIYSIAAESTSSWPKYRGPEKYHTEIASTDMRGYIEDFYSSGKKYDYDPCQSFYMEDNGHGEYTFTAYFPSFGGEQKFTLKKEDVFKEEE
jgi:hypothetical protein